MVVVHYLWVKYYRFLGFAGGGVSLASLLEFGSDLFGFLGAFFGAVIAGISLFRLLFSDKEREADNQRKRREKLDALIRRVNPMQWRK